MTEPAVGASRPTIIRMVVDFPAPFGPRKPVTSPGFTVKDRRPTTVLSPYRLVSSLASIMASVLSFLERGPRTLRDLHVRRYE
ncbi:hypothetical protein CU044_1163 [Streptomyces sp. L-9-10]|nr:hypothetical protein CU044_1163 [Streptomyces sp. L-9-10]